MDDIGLCERTGNTTVILAGFIYVLDVLRGWLDAEATVGEVAKVDVQLQHRLLLNLGTRCTRALSIPLFVGRRRPWPRPLRQPIAPSEVRLATLRGGQ